jgi:hypothetical protein
LEKLSLTVHNDYIQDKIRGYQSRLQETLQKIKTLAENCLQKAGLIELSEKLNSLSGEK